MPSRRSFLAMTAGGLLLPRRARPATLGVEHKFLFVFCAGGWDTSKVFTPDFESGNVDMAATDEPASANGIAYCASPSRPSVSSWFETYGGRTCVLNGIEVRSIAHERCTRLILTGDGGADLDDWPSTIAAASAQAPLAPHLVVIGSAYNSRYSSAVVRVGANGQLPVLLDGSALTDQSDTVLVPPTSATISQVDAYVKRRAAALQDAAGRGWETRFADRYATAVDQVAAFSPLAADLDLAADIVGCQRDMAADCAVAFSCFEKDISRCAMVRYKGECQFGWDTHFNNSLQDEHYEGLFARLAEAVADLDGRTASDGSSLADHTTIVVISEMGRGPLINSAGGRDHWTFTSAMLIGAGIRGGQVIGAHDSDYLGQPVDLATGELDDGGNSLLPGHLGATLYTLAGMDPVEAGIDEAPILAALS